MRESRTPAAVEHALVDAQQHLVSVDELLLELGLFGDTSQNDLIEEMEWAALGRCSTIIDAPVRTIDVTDRFVAFSERLLLSPGFYSATPAIVVEYFDAAGDVQTLAADRYLVDATMGIPAVVMRGNGVAPPSLSPWHAAPVSVRWRSDTTAPGHHDAREAVLQAVRLLVGARWETRGGEMAGAQQPMENLVVRLLSPFRRSKGVYR